MKKQILTITAVLTALILFSCKKENTPAPAPTPDPDLQAWFKFDHNFADNSGKTADATPTGNPSFTTDRKGNANSAVYFDGASKLVTNPVVYKGLSTSVCVWLKYAQSANSYEYPVSATGNSVKISQLSTSFNGVVDNPNTASAKSDPLDANWHHVAVTWDGTDIKLYIDGMFTMSTNNPGNINDGTRSFVLAFSNGSYWQGYEDDLRIYSRLLTASEIQKIASE